MAELGLQAYRFSLSWPRILPQGRGRPLAAGLDFYERLVDALLAKGILPFATLYHWDLPQALEDAGGWLSRATPEAFADFAELAFRRLGDRVRHWMTLNEIPIFVSHGYALGVHAPGLKLDRRAVNRAYHHAFLAHGLAVRRARECAPGAHVGLVNNPLIPVPVLEDPENIAAASRAFRRLNAYLQEPIFRGAYPDWWLEEQGPDGPEIRTGDMETIASPCDFHGLNVYSGVFAESAAGELGYRLLPFPKGYPKLALDWLKPVPQAIYWGCRFLREEYGVPDLYVAECGCACEDALDGEGRVLDLDRVEWLRLHLREASRAAEAGLLRGLFAWSLLDNFEWQEGTGKRFGLVRVDFDTQTRLPKESARWVRDFIRRRGGA